VLPHQGAGEGESIRLIVRSLANPLARFVGRRLEIRTNLFLQLLDFRIVGSLSRQDYELAFRFAPGLSPGERFGETKPVGVIALVAAEKRAILASGVGVF